MNKRLLVIIAAIVIAAHALFLWLRFSTPRDAAEGATSVAEQEENSPAEESQPEPAEPTIEAPAARSSEPGASSLASVEKAVSTVKSAAPPPPGAPDGIRPPIATAESEGELEEGTLTVGLHKGVAKLPSELKELAEQGAKAVASLNWSEAREAYLEMVKQAPDNALAYANLGVAEFQLGNLVAASGNLRRSLELNHSIAQNWQTLGLIQYEQGKLALAISSLTRAVHEAPNNAQSRVYLAAVARDYGWKEAAITELERAIQVDPKLADAHYNLAVSYLSEKPARVELARRHYYNAIDLGAEPSPDLEQALQPQP
ncbi:MAG: tetratricopeptide repeat protein [Verrucomicrobiota bacterium]